jgi:hypothetical protein
MTPEELRAKASKFRDLASRVTASGLAGELITWAEECEREADEQASAAPREVPT